MPSTPGIGYDDRRGIGRGRSRGCRGWNGGRYMNVQCHQCGQYGHIMRTCLHLSQGYPSASYPAPAPTPCGQPLPLDKLMLTEAILNHLNR